MDQLWGVGWHRGGGLTCSQTALFRWGQLLQGTTLLDVGEVSPSVQRWPTCVAHHSIHWTQVVFVPVMFPCTFHVLPHSHQSSESEPDCEIHGGNTYSDGSLTIHSRTAGLRMHWHRHLRGLSAFRTQTGQKIVSFGDYKASYCNFAFGHAWRISLLDMETDSHETGHKVSA